MGPAPRPAPSVVLTVAACLHALALPAALPGHAAPEDPREAFLRLNPDYRTRVGAFYEDAYLPGAVRGLLASLAPEGPAEPVARAILRDFVHEWIDQYVEGGGAMTPEAHARLLARLDARVRELAHRPEALRGYEAWKAGHDPAANPLAFLTRPPPAPLDALETRPAEGSRIRGPLGWRALDFNPGLWASLPDEQKLRGRVGDVLAYEGMRAVFILRCSMHVAGRGHLESTIRAAIPPDGRFSRGEVPGGQADAGQGALLDLLFETSGGEVGLLKVHTRFTIVEVGGRMGLIALEAGGGRAR